MKMSRKAKRMERHHRRNKGHAVINIVSMIDMLTVLVLFLLVNSGNMQNLPSTKSVKLPESIAQKAPKESLVVAVNNEDIIAQGRKVASVPEAIAARHMGATVLGISLVTNLAAGISPTPLTHEEVQETASMARDRFTKLLDHLLPELG